MRRMLSVLFSVLVVPTLLACAVGAEVKTVPVVRITVETEISAPPAAVWKQVTEGKNLVTWCPLWKTDKNAAVRLTKVGDVLDFTDQWGNGGRSVVTFLAAPRELRVAHEPDNGSYLCQARIILAASGKGTHLTYVEQYTDESPDTDREATAAKMTIDMQTTLAALKKNAER